MPGSDRVNASTPGVKLTYDDFVLFPDDGLRHELIDGEHYVTPSPNLKHQKVSGNLYLLIRSWLADHPVGRIFYAPLDVVISKHDVVEPSDADSALGIRGASRLDTPCIRHCRLLSLAMDHSTAIRRGRQSDYCGAGWDGCVVARRGCWLRQARISARSRTPSWLVSIWSKRAPARCPTRSWTRCRYCSRVMPPVPEGAGGAEVELSTAAVCGAVWAKVVAGSNDNPTRATMAIERIFYDFRLMMIRL